MSFRPPHPLPLEVIERIFELAFLPDSPLTINSSSRVTPPPGTHNFLLVSHAIRSFCLPLFFRSITILRSQDWISFFDAKHGIFVAQGSQEDAQDRWSMVQELALFVEAVPPCRAGESILQEVDDICLHSLTIPTRKNSQLLKLIVLDTVPPQILRPGLEDEGGDLSLRLSTLASPLGLPSFRAQAGNAWRMGILAQRFDQDEYISEEVFRLIGRRLKLERGQVLKTLLQNTYPLNITSSFSSWRTTLTSFPEFETDWDDHVVLLPTSNEDADDNDNDNDSSFLPPTLHLLWTSHDPFGELFIGRGTIIQYVNSLKEVHKFIPGAQAELFDFPVQVVEEFKAALEAEWDDEVWEPYEGDVREPSGSWRWKTKTGRRVLVEFPEEEDEEEESE